MELSNLPNELIALIAEHLDEQDLRSLTIASSHLRDIAEPILYEILFIRTGAECQRLLETLQHGRKERAASVHGLELRALYRHEIGLQHFPAILALAKNLRTLVIESPVCNTMRWRGDGNWPILMTLFSKALCDASSPAQQSAQSPPLQCLKKLILHWNGPASRFWDTYAMFDALFCSKSLEELCISCANCPDTLLDAAKARHLSNRTPLKRMTLIECNITAKGLLGMLSMPAALEHLYLGENRDHVSSRYSGDSRDHVSLQYSGNRFSEEPTTLFEALRLHCGSLRSFHYRPQLHARHGAEIPVQARNNGVLSFQSFEKLETIILEEGCSSLTLLVLAEESRPPNLETIQFNLEVKKAPVADAEHKAVVQALNKGVPLQYADLVCFADKALTIPSLKKFNIILTSSYLEDRAEDHISATAQYIQNLFSKTVIVRVLVERQMAGRGRLIPPYLYGEWEPWFETAYHGGVGKWQGRSSSRRAWASPSPSFSESDSEDLEELFEGDGEIEDPDFDDFPEYELDDNDDDEEVNEEV